MPSDVSAPAGGSERRTRRDALANQERLLAAAVAAMLREGRHVPMTTIAGDAGVGVGTLYRHYPSREDLLHALTERSFGMVLAVAESAAARPGRALDALDWFFDRTIEHRAQLVLPLHGGPTELRPESRTLRDGVHAAIARILERGRADGTVRADVTTADVVTFGATLAQPLSSVPDWDRVARRQKQLFLLGLSAPLVDPGQRS